MADIPDNVTRQLATIDLSKLHRYSFGIVIEDNVNNESKIKIFPVEKLFSLGGDLTKEDKWSIKKIKERVIEPTDEYKPKYVPSKEDLELMRTRYIYANWIASNNQITPPNVCKGEYVTIYRYSNRDEYYWSTELTDLTLRKEEHVVYTFSDKPNLDKSEDPIEDRYTITVSPKNKTISLHTTDKYGEYTKYDLIFKTDEGYIELKDGKNNSIKLDSTQDMLTIHIEGTGAKYDATIHGDESYAEIKDDSGNSLSLNSKFNSLTATTQTSFNVNSPTINLQCDLLNVTSAATMFHGGSITHDGKHIDKSHYHIGNLGKPTSPPAN